MEKKYVAWGLSWVLTAYVSSVYGKCDLPTKYKSCYYYMIFVTKPEKMPGNFYLVLTKNKHSLYGGECHRKTNDEPIILFKSYDATKDPLSRSRAFVHYEDFMDAINSDQPAHNVRVRSGDHYITLSKVAAREFRNGLAGRVLNKIVDAGRP